MIQSSEKHDQLLNNRLNSLSSLSEDYWSFKGNSKREHGHGFFQYPAMMVPQMVGVVLDEVCAVHPEVECIGDPFFGSGTILTESMLRGLEFTGKDVNPLAVLLCKTKSGPFFSNALKVKIELLFDQIETDKKWRIEVDFPGRDKWFRKDVQIALSKIRRAIVKEQSLWARRFYWVALADTVRRTSNSRTSTFKLHIREENQLIERKLDPIALFKKNIQKNFQHYKNQEEKLKENKNLNKGHYRKYINIQFGDTRVSNSKKNYLSDIILTSPPYGDNATTVPYGQYSYLPLQWINLNDIDPKASSDYLKSTNEIDARSLGGSKRIESDTKQYLSDLSPSFSRFINRIKSQPLEQEKKVTAFFRDLDSCIDPVLDSLNSNGLLIWTLGNRRVGGKQVPLDKVLLELFVSRKAKLITTLTRKISSKRMALKNDTAKTMTTETILIMRK